MLKEQVQHILNVSAKNITTFKGGGRIKSLYLPKNIEELNLLLNENFFILGKGSNVIIDDGVQDILGISLKAFDSINLDKCCLKAGAGVTATKLLTFCSKNNLSGLEFLTGIPATVGGLVKMNAGAFGRDISKVVSKCEILSNGKIEEIVPNFGYRSSDIDGVVLSATFCLDYTQNSEVERQINIFSDSRKLKQPQMPSCGSVFKNPSLAAAGKLIESCGLKGLQKGGAEISHKHCNFIVNHGEATASDFLYLVDKIKEMVYYNYGIELEEEFKLLTDEDTR